MSNRIVRLFLILLNGFLALTSIAGGLALLTGTMAPPLEYLVGSPFPNYVIPGLALALLVGGSSLATTILLVTRRQLAGLAALATGLAIIIFETVEVMAIGSPTGVARSLQVLYFAVGILIVFASLLPVAELRRSLVRS